MLIQVLYRYRANFGNPRRKFVNAHPQLVHDGHAHVLEAPSRVHNREKTIYSYSETERDNAVREPGGKPDITDSKAWRNQPKKSRYSSARQMRLSKVECAPKVESGPQSKASRRGSRASPSLTVR